MRGIAHPTIVIPPGARWQRVLEIEPPRRKRRALVQCLCGNEKWVPVDTLRRGGSKSCGCLKKGDRSRAGRHPIHGESTGKKRTRLYGIWRGMIVRTTYPKADSWKWYGGKGIRICDEWRHDYAAFRAWAHAHGYRDDLTIDRIDPNGNYEPANCRWLPASENTRWRTGR